MKVCTVGGSADDYRSAAMPFYLNTWHVVSSFGENVERSRYGSAEAPGYTGGAFFATATDNVIGVGCRNVRGEAMFVVAPDVPSVYYCTDVRPCNFHLGREKGVAENVAGPSCCDSTALLLEVEIYV